MKKRILLVEDNPDCRQIFGFYLRHMGYELIEALDGREGISYAKNARPDLIILDLGLPDMNGFAVLASLKQEPATREVPVVILTAMAVEATKAKALKAGAEAFLPKPISPVVLNETIREFFDPIRSTSGARLPVTERLCPPVTQSP